MTLTTDEMHKIMVDEMTGREQRVTGTDAAQFLEEFRKDVELAKEEGWQIEIPAEYPDPDA